MSVLAAAEAEIDELVALVRRWQPDFGEQLVGAEAELLAKIEAGLGLGLAPDHRAFLARMGRHSDGLDAYGDDTIDLRAPALLEFIEAGFNPDPSMFVIAGVPSEVFTHWLVFDRRGGLEPAPLVRLGAGSGDAPVITPEHSSLSAMLFSFAFITKCLPRFGWELHLESPGTRLPSFPGRAREGPGPRGRWLPRFAELVDRLGFAPIPNTGPWCVCAEGQDAAVMMFECPAYSPDVRVAARGRVELARLVEILSENLELRPRPTSLRQPP